MGKKYRQRILEYIEAVDNKIRSPDAGKNLSLLGEVYAWQEIQAFAKKRLAVLWAKMEIAGVIPSDDVLRTVREQRVEATTENFSCVVKVDEPRLSLDEEAFILKLSKKYKIPTQELVALASKCRKSSKPVLTKRIVELQPTKENTRAKTIESK